MKKHTAVVASGLAAATILISGVAFAQTDAFPSEIGVGAQSTEVTSLQTWLENNGYYNGPVTGYFGTLTEAGVKNFQTANGISDTGYVGPLTLAALNAKASGTTTANSSTLAQLEAELNSLLAQIQSLEASGGVTTTTTTIPVGANISLQTNENTGVSGMLITSSGTSPFTYAISSDPLDGTITAFNSSTGAFTYTPNSNYTGTDTFRYTVTNSSGISAPMTVNVTVEPGTTTSGVPIGQALSFSTSGNVAYNGTLSASGSSPYTYSITGEPTHGIISNFNNSTGAFTYIPNSGYTGSDTFTYTVSNSYGVSSPVTVTVNNGSASAPAGQSLSFSTANGAALNGTLTASGSGPYTYAIVTNPSYGTITNFSSTNGSFTYIPTTSTYTGTDSFTYEVGNASATSSPYTVNIAD